MEEKKLRWKITDLVDKVERAMNQKNPEMTECLNNCMKISTTEIYDFGNAIMWKDHSINFKEKFYY